MTWETQNCEMTKLFFNNWSVSYTLFQVPLAETKPSPIAKVEEICENDAYSVRHKVVDIN